MPEKAFLDVGVPLCLQKVHNHISGMKNTWISFFRLTAFKKSSHEIVSKYFSHEILNKVKNPSLSMC